MKKLCALSLVMLMVVAVSGIANADAYQDGGNRLVDLQNDDGGWDWPLDNGDSTTSSPMNTIGPITMGLAEAYAQTSDADMLAALQSAGSMLLTKTNTFSPTDGYMAVQLDSILGGTTYVDHIKTYFYDALATGTYQRSGDTTLYDTASYVGRIRTIRSGSTANLAAWDIGMGLYAANLVGADTSVWTTALKAEIDELDGNNNYDVIGLAGAVMGLASINEDYNPTAGQHADAANLMDLADILAGYQISSGGFAWNSNYVIADDYNEAIQETAYALLALNELDASAFAAEILAAGGYLEAAQLATGGWENYYGGGENNEVTGEALWAMGQAPEPATMSILALGGLLLRKRK